MTGPSPLGRSLIALLTMLVTFAVLAAVFIALDNASGVRVAVPNPLASRSTRTPTATATAGRPTPTSTPHPRPTDTTRASPGATHPAASITATATATASATPLTPTATIRATETALPTPSGLTSPPRYGALLNYTNNTTFSPGYLQTLDTQIITLTNKERTAHGLSPLTENGQLDIIAAARSEDLIKRNYCDHFDPTGPLDAAGHRPAAVQELLARNNVAYNEVGENLICDSGYAIDNSTPERVVQAWMNHKEHRDNILHASYTQIGVGMATEDEADGLHVVVTQVFLH